MMYSFFAALFCVVFSLSANHSPVSSPAPQNLDAMEKEYGSNPSGDTTTGMLEFLYGDTFMSAGKTDAVDLMLRGLALTGKKLVDIGCGFGGADIYLAQKYPVTIIGLDPVKKTIEKARKNATVANLTKQLSYHHTPTLPYPLKDESVDVVFSKEALLHAPDKKAIIREIFRILKPGGQLRIIDWAFGPKTSQETKQSFEIPSFSMVTRDEYLQNLKSVGFKGVSSTILNEKYCAYTQQSINHLKANKAAWDKLSLQYSYENTLEDWKFQYSTFKNKQVLVSLFKAHKPMKKKTATV